LPRIETRIIEPEGHKKSLDRRSNLVLERAIIQLCDSSMWQFCRKRAADPAFVSRTIEDGRSFVDIVKRLKESRFQIGFVDCEDPSAAESRQPPIPHSLGKSSEQLQSATADQTQGRFRGRERRLWNRSSPHPIAGATRNALERYG
jgi:hypothetical protein